MRSACACVCESWEGEQRPSENTFSLILILFLFYCKVPNNCYRWFQTRYDEGTLFANFSDFCPLPAEESLVSSQSWTVACPSNLSHFFFIIPICIWTVYFLRSSSLGFTQSKCGYQIATVELGYHCDLDRFHMISRRPNWCTRLTRLLRWCLYHKTPVRLISFHV